MLNKSNSMKAVMAVTALAAVLALLMAAAQPVRVAASGSQSATAAAGALASLEAAAVQAYHGSVQLAQEMRSLYSVYQLISSAKATPATSSAVTSNDSPRVVACRDFTPARTKQEEKRKRLA